MLYILLHFLNVSSWKEQIIAVVHFPPDPDSMLYAIRSFPEIITVDI